MFKFFAVLDFGADIFIHTSQTILRRFYSITLLGETHNNGDTEIITDREINKHSTYQVSRLG